MRIPDELRERIRQARRLSLAIERRTKRILHQELARLPRIEAALLKAALGRCCGSTAGPISRQAREGDLPVQRRLLVALEVLAPRIAVRIRNMEQRTREQAGLVGEHDFDRAACRTGALTGRFAALVCEAKADGRWEPREVDAVEASLPELQAAVEDLAAVAARRRVQQVRAGQ